MLNVDQYSYIRTAHRVYGKKIKQIARETGHSKNTIKEEFQMKDITIYNTLKGRLETVNFEFTTENTTWFDDVEDYDIYRIADAFGGLLIQETGYTYPILIGDVSRSDVGNNQQKALELLQKQI